MRPYNNFWELAPELKASLSGEIIIPQTPFRAHHFIRKFRIISQSGPVSKDKRTGYNSSWKPRGSERHKFWYDGKAGLPRVTIDWHPGTIVAYCDKGQDIYARSHEEARQTGWLAVYQAVEQFRKAQSAFGVDLELENAGQQIGKVHMGALCNEGGVLAAMKEAQDKIPGERVMNAKNPVWIDKSTGQNTFEIEAFEDHPLLTPVESTVQTIADFKKELPETIRTAMPEALRELKKVGPLTAEVHAVLAHISSGQSVDNRLNQLIIMFGDMLKQHHQTLDEMQNIRLENAELKKKIGM